MVAARSERRYSDGRDEMNLADFPISVLQRQQPLDERGDKRDTISYESSRYDPRGRQRVQQRVTLESSSRHGLPTPADENVILALLYVAKHTHNFAEPVVPFAPRQLFHIMGWAPNSRSYDRLRDVLRRLKALVIRYENSWWDAAGRGYEAEKATGIVSEYELARQVSGRRKDGQVPASWVRWTPHFQSSLSNGNLKKLDLEKLFALRLPTSQRMYRFLDKRFYQSPVVEMDLFDFACGHLGLNRIDNVAELKRRLQPALTELESIGFLAPLTPEERFRKVRPGVWRVVLRSTTAPVTPVEREPVKSLPVDEVTQLVAEYYRLWDANRPATPGESDLAEARTLVETHGAATVRAVLPHLVRVVKRCWPECKSFRGAASKYLPDALHLLEQEQRREALKQQSGEQQQRQRADVERAALERRQALEAWQRLPEGVREEIEQSILARYPEHRGRAAIVQTLCLDELGRRGATD